MAASPLEILTESRYRLAKTKTTSLVGASSRSCTKTAHGPNVNVTTMSQPKSWSAQNRRERSQGRMYFGETVSIANARSHVSASRAMPQPFADRVTVQRSRWTARRESHQVVHLENDCHLQNAGRMLERPRAKGRISRLPLGPANPSFLAGKP